MKKKILIAVSVALIAAFGLYINDHKQSDLRADFVKQVKNLPIGDLSSSQCKKLFEELKEKDLISSKIYKVAEDYVYINSKKMCITLTKSDGGLSDDETVIDLGTNNILYFYGYSALWPDYLNVSMFGKSVSTSTTFFTSRDMFIYLKDNLK